MRYMVGYMEESVNLQMDDRWSGTLMIKQGNWWVDVCTYIHNDILDEVFTWESQVLCSGYNSASYQLGFSKGSFPPQDLSSSICKTRMLD